MNYLRVAVRVANFFCRIFLCVLVLPASAGEKGQALGEDDAAYYVIGVAPANTPVVIEPGTIKDGRFVEDGPFVWQWDDPDVVKKPDDGFIVAKITKDQPLGLIAVGYETPPSVFRQGVLGLVERDIKHSTGATDYTSFDVCGDRSTVVFTPEPGRVLYIGNLDFTFVADRSFLLGGRDKLGVSAHNDIEKARAYLARKYPDLAGRLEQGSYARYSSDRGCRPRVTVLPSH